MRNKRRWISTVLFTLYSVFIIWYTVLCRTPKGEHTAELRLLWSYRDYIAGRSTAKKDILQNLQNIFFFIPFGFLFPKKKWTWVFIGALALSLCVEITQYIGGFGLAELDDVICNALGALIGYWIFISLKKVLRRKNEHKEHRREELK